MVITRIKEKLDKVKHYLFRAGKEDKYIVEVSGWLTQQVRSQIRKNQPFNIEITALQYAISKEFLKGATPSQLIDIFNQTSRNLGATGIVMLVDNKHMYANRPISREMLQ